MKKSKKKMEFEETAELIAKYLLGTLDTEEEDRLRQWTAENEANRQLLERMADPRFVQEKMNQWRTIQPPETIERKDTPAKPAHKPFPVWRVSAAAAVLLLLVAGGVLLNRSNQRYRDLKTRYDKEHYVASIKPGETKATLTTESGRTIVLGGDEKSNSQAIAAVKSKQEQEMARKRQKAQEDRIALNNLEIPRGGEFHITLEDGTEVWLNAESTLKYPDHFDGNTRAVALTGEAYFKVAKDGRGRPFFVKTAGQCVRVYGTEFNIFSYDEDQFVYTTLVNGCISLMRENSQDSELILTPGHQAVFGKADGATKVKPVATDVVTSWRNGMFVFQDQTLDQIMRQLSRWYNFTYSFTTEEAANTLFMGRMARSSKFGEVLEILEQSGHLKFDVKDNHIVISKSTNL